ncbi:MAG: T9SS type A sorting domain-containing protein [Oceanospirillaceae bacterium]|nr:T9SS type A sorting domain-containing protein [Oceanospirillaceae bacterium]
MKYTVPIAGTLTHLNLLGLGTNANVQMALYQDSAGIPQQLLAYTLGGTVGNGNIALPVVTQIFLPAGDYWIMAVYSNRGGHSYRTFAGTKRTYYQALTYGSTLPYTATGFSSYCCRDYRYWMTITTPDTLRGTDYQIACEPITWIDGQTYSTSNSTATYTVTSSVGCDSIVTLDLEIISIDTTLLQSGLLLTSNENGASYQWLDCNLGYSVIPGEVNQSYQATKSGTYAVEITKSGCVDTSDCYLASGIDLDEFSSNSELKFSLFPNPSAGDLTLQFDEPKTNIDVTIYDLYGRIIHTEHFNQIKSTSISIAELTGVYLVKITDCENGASEMERLVIY